MTYRLKERDQERVKPLLDEIYEEGINFLYFITLNYESKVTDDVEVNEDNHHLKLKLRRYFKRPVKFLFTLEKHLGNDNSYFFNTYHRHILMSKVEGITCRKLKSIIQSHHRNIARDTWGRKGCVIRPITDIEKACSYVTKQIDYPQLNVDRRVVIDATNSDIGKDHYSVRGLHRDPLYRHRRTSSPTNRSLSNAAR